MNMDSASSEESKRQRERTDNIEAFEGRTGSLDVCFFQQALEKSEDTVFSDRSIEPKSVTSLGTLKTKLTDSSLSESLDPIHELSFRGRGITAVTDTPIMNRYLPTHWYRLPFDPLESTEVTAS